MTLYHGATHNLEDLINTHLFIICPNNSGSTFLKEALSTCMQTWNLMKEGQHTHGFAGPSTRKTRSPLLWAADPESIATFTDSNLYNWPTTRLSWYFQAYSYNPKASIFATKSPPFLLNVEQLQKHFNNAKFLLMVRNPYAVIEGIIRRRRKIKYQDIDLIHIAATHIMTCFKFQQKNIEGYPLCSTFFTYEEMCEEPNKVEQKVKMLAPELNDLILDQRLAVKGLYNEKLRNMNTQQISRLNSEQIKQINQVFQPYSELIEYFGYRLI